MKVRLKDIAEVINGSTPSTQNPEYYDGDIIWITPKDLSDQNSKYIYSGERSITQAGYNSCSTKMIPENNILMSSRAPIGLLAINKVECCTNQGFKSLIVDKTKCNVEYLYYYLKYHIKEIESLGSGTTFKEVSKDSMEKYEIMLPSIKVQETISNVLSLLDKKIIINNKINVELESMAKTLYDYWFLQFEFPNEEGKPYKSSGGKMIWNEELKREIPEGWRVENLKDITALSLGGTPSRDKKEYWGNGTINWLNSGEISNFPIITSEEKITRLGLENSATEYMKKGTVVISITGNIRASILGIDSCANQSVVGISESGIYKKEYLYPAISMLLDQFTKISTGNCQQHINKKTLEESKTLIPPDSILQNYYLQVKPLYSAILNNTFQNQELSSLRDFLLPMLMNGQVTFKS